MPIFSQQQSSRTIRIIAAAIIISFAQPGTASASDFDCAAAVQGEAEQKLSAATELLNHSYDTAMLACGAQVLVNAANSQTANYGAQLTALKANAHYIYYLDRIVLYELGYLISWYVTEVPQETKMNAPMVALMTAQQEQMRLIQQARDADSDAIETAYYEALTIGPNAKIIPLLKPVVATDPKSLKGAAHALLAETYYTLPDLIGGDLDLGIEFMQAASQRDPDNPLYRRLLAGYLLDNGQTEDASKLLKSIMSLKPDMAGWQLLADQLRAAAGLAERVGDNELAAELTENRDSMLEQHPYLQTRLTVSAMGHFGSKDPMQESN